MVHTAKQNMPNSEWKWTNWDEEIETQTFNLKIDYFYSNTWKGVPWMVEKNSLESITDLTIQSNGEYHFTVN